MRILLVKTSSLGDVIHNLPVVSDILARYPDASIDWVVEENFAELPALHPGVTTVIPVALRRWRKNLFARATWEEMAACYRAISRHEYDFVIDTQGLLKSALITWCARGLRCGHDAGSAREGIASIAYDRNFAVDTKLHAVARNRALVALALGNANDEPLNYGIAIAPQPAATKPTAVLLTATSRDDKLWPEARWIALGRKLSELGMTCALPGGSAVERERASRLARAIPDAIALAPLRLSELARELSAAQIVIGVDTGLVHLAAALGRPTIALYCASDPLLTGVFALTPFQNLGARDSPPTLDAVLQTTTAMLDLPVLA